MFYKLQYGGNDLICLHSVIFNIKNPTYKLRYGGNHLICVLSIISNIKDLAYRLQYGGNRLIRVPINSIILNIIVIPQPGEPSFQSRTTKFILFSPARHDGYPTNRVPSEKSNYSQLPLLIEQMPFSRYTNTVY